MIIKKIWLKIKLKYIVFKTLKNYKKLFKRLEQMP